MRELYIGLMSGTSMDALDGVLVDLSENLPKIRATTSLPLHPTLRQRLTALCKPGFDEIQRMGVLDIEMAELSVQAVKNLLQTADVSPADICAIGSHGQTIRHYPHGQYPFTLQIGDPNVIAEKTSITTIADFRRRDMAAGGQGAPLAPAFHQAIFQDEKQNRIVLNLGGIANITWLPADKNQSVIGFDTGPASTLLDAWIHQHGNIPYDKNGEWAASGKINADLLAQLLADPYFQKSFPKSTGREYFNLAWLEKFLVNFTLPPQDIQATLCELTACSILQAIKLLTKNHCDILICGGGIKNLYLIERLKINGSQHSFYSTADFGVPPEWMEAVAFAWLAQQTFHKKTSNLPTVTGAKNSVLLGGVYYSN